MRRHRGAPRRDLRRRVHLAARRPVDRRGAESLGEFPEVGWDKVMDTNVKGVFFLTQALLPLLEAATSTDDPSRVTWPATFDTCRIGKELTHDNLVRSTLPRTGSHLGGGVQPTRERHVSLTPRRSERRPLLLASRPSPLRDFQRESVAGETDRHPTR